MTDTTAPPRFRQGSGRLCLDFVRTLRYRGTPGVAEELADPAALVAWVRQCGPPVDGPRSAAPPTAADVRDARALREAAYALVSAALAAGGPAAPTATARVRLNRAAAAAVPVPYLTAAGELRRRADDPVRAVLALVARDALELAASPALLPRLHACASPECGALFLDNSRPGTRRWCSMDICGNRAKKSTFRARS
ncbi:MULTISPECIES: CGNR zinc finger domain-containing protein [unclassified Streptomyces]|uniref:CGNR zinc finger domain-containing protein n=1 Tax=unclassified Streptomyces TaxID=2593676 RepID=UPI002E33621A|nr:ABATE domain-containing protein [Streptomyces sp. NBC_01477]